jgi:UDP-glucose 4-epimerase
MKKILVTGHRGWIGSNLTKLLDQAGMSWIGIDAKDGEQLSLDMSVFLNKVQDCDVVVHLAATPRIPASWRYPDHYRINNVDVTDMVARICAEQGKHLIFSSSSSVYGNGDGPLNPYSWTKLAGEESIKMYSRAKDLKYTILRIFTNYGEDDPSGLVIGKWIQNYKTGNPLLVRGNGEQSRDFIHVMDTARAILACCEQQPKNKTLDIGTGESHKLINIAEIFNTTLDFEPELEGYAHSTEANLVNTQEHLIWWPRIILPDWIRRQIQ